MKVFICGQKSFGKAVLKRLYEDGHEIVGVAPPPQGRLKDKMVGYAQLKGIPLVSDCEKLTADYIPAGTELIVSAHSHWIISDKCIEKSLHGGIGFHPSLLPRHRGQDAVRWAVHMGDFISGGTIYRLDSKCDAGDIILQNPVFIEPGWDYHDLWSAIFPVGVELVSKAVRQIEEGKAEFKKQNEACATWEPSWERPRLKRNDLVMIGDVVQAAPVCGGCNNDCGLCTYHISDPEIYHRVV